jgi:serine phosphatase RsbU (regulator of sigma subunit)
VRLPTIAFRFGMDSPSKPGPRTALESVPPKAMLEGLRILLVEDDDVDRMRVHRALRKAAASMTLVDATTVGEARRLLEQGGIDCAVVDYNLPDGTVLDVLDYIAEHHTPLPVVVLTGDVSDARAIEALQRGAEDYLVKSEFAVDTFMRAVRYALERYRLRRALEATNLRLQRELEIGGSIQTSILPRKLEVAGYEIAAAMRPATEVGGDYYDVVPLSGGALVGIGDVAGHGMAAAVVALMVQSIVGTLALARPDLSPSHVVELLNEVLYDNIKNRMRQDEHVTLTLLRVDPDGRVVFAGAHEDIVVYRASNKACECVPTLGTWLGARRAIGDVTSDRELRLGKGDVMLLYSDGVIEAQNASGEPYGLERLCAGVARHHGEPAATIHQLLWDEILAWTEVQDDDVTLLVLRCTDPEPQPGA